VADVGGFVDTLGPGCITVAAGTSAQLLPLNENRNGVQVVVDMAATATVYLLCGSGTASALNWHFVLGAGGSWDGMFSGRTWRGAVQFYSAGTPNVGVVEV
jgi:hypothetical protein